MYSNTIEKILGRQVNTIYRLSREFANQPNMPDLRIPEDTLIYLGIYTPNQHPDRPSISAKIHGFMEVSPELARALYEFPHLEPRDALTTSDVVFLSGALDSDDVLNVLIEEGAVTPEQIYATFRESEQRARDAIMEKAKAGKLTDHIKVVVNGDEAAPH